MRMQYHGEAHRLFHKLIRTNNRMLLRGNSYRQLENKDAAVRSYIRLHRIIISLANAPQAAKGVDVGSKSDRSTEPRVGLALSPL